MTMPGEKEELKDFLDDTFKTMDAVLADQHPELTQREVGLVHYVGYGIVRVSGLPNIRAEEIVLFPKNVQGLVFNIDPEEIGVILLGASEHLNSGSEVRRTGRILDVPVGEALIGRVVDAIGRPLDNQGEIRAAKTASRRARGAARHGERPRHRPPADGHQGDRRPHPHRARAAGTHRRGPTDGENGHRPGHDHQPVGQERHLHLLRHRQEVLRRGQGHRRPQAAQRHEVHHRRSRRGRRPPGAAVHRTLRGDLHGRVLHVQGARRPGHLRRPHLPCACLP